MSAGSDDNARNDDRAADDGSHRQRLSNGDMRQKRDHQERQRINGIRRRQRELSKNEDPQNGCRSVNHERRQHREGKEASPRRPAPSLDAPLSRGGLEQHLSN